jgi:hypothetical protein
MFFEPISNIFSKTFNLLSFFVNHFRYFDFAYIIQIIKIEVINIDLILWQLSLVLHFRLFNLFLIWRLFDLFVLLGIFFAIKQCINCFLTYLKNSS